MLIREEADGMSEPLVDRGRVAQASPVDALEAGRHVLGQPGRQAGLADTAHAEDRYQATALVQHPAPQQRQLVGAADEAQSVRGLTPILGTLDRRRSRGGGQQGGEPRGVERGVHAWRLALGRRPECACLGRLLPDGQAARLEQHLDKDLESLSGWVVEAGFPVLNRAAADASMGGEVALDQSGPPAVAEEQAAKRLRRTRALHAPWLAPRPSLANCAPEVS